MQVDNAEKKKANIIMNMLNNIDKLGIVQTIDDLLGNKISHIEYLLCRTTGRCYFGAYLASTQGKKIRHHFMTQLVKYYCDYSKEKILLLEIGSWAGGSAITWAKAIKKYSYDRGSIICIDPWVDYIDNGVNKDWTHKTMKKALVESRIYKLFLHNISASGLSEMISILQGSSKEMLPYIREGVADMIFIDGDHSYDAVLSDIIASTSLLKDGGILCGDDLELQYQEVDQAAINNFKYSDVITDPKTKKRYHPGVSMAVHDYFKIEVSTWEGLWAMQKKQGKFHKVYLLEGHKAINIPRHLK